jgi:ABC-type microcin C transport system duplicated ATPase subunit YejF
MILQNPMTSLDPLFTIGNQLGEVLATRCDVPGSQLRERELELLRSVHMTAPEERLRQYPHELSGGMRQRVLIAMAGSMAPSCCSPTSPTTALDATIQEEILVLFRELRDRRGPRLPSSPTTSA